MRRAKTEITLVTVLNLEHLRTKHRPAASFFPQLFWLYGWHQQFQRARFVHFIPHNVFNLAQHTQAQRHPAIQATTELFDQPGTHHEFMTDEFSVRWSFFLGGNEKL